MDFIKNFKIKNFDKQEKMKATCRNILNNVFSLLYIYNYIYI